MRNVLNNLDQFVWFSAFTQLSSDVVYANVELDWTAILRTELTFAPQTTTALSTVVHPSSRQNKDNILYATHPLA